jgi:hypothetical protein
MCIISRRNEENKLNYKKKQERFWQRSINREVFFVHSHSQGWTLFPFSQNLYITKNLISSTIGLQKW